MVVACGKDDGFDNFNGSKESEGNFDATFTDQTVYFDASETDRDVVSIDEARMIYTLRNSSDKAKNLKKGDIILLHGKALGKVERVTTQGSNIVVEAVHADLNELIEDGTIEWTTYCDFHPDMELEAMVGDEVFAPKTRAGKTVKFDFEYGGYKYSISMEMNNDKGKVKIEMTKPLGPGLAAKFAAEGEVSAFYSQNKIEFKNRELQHYGHANKNLQGDITLSATVAGSGNAALDYKPAVILGKYAFMVGPIPTVITLKMQILLNAVVPLDGSARLETRFKYNSETGFSYDGTDVKTKGRIGDYSLEDKAIDTGASSAIAVNFGIGFPRIEVGIFGNLVVPWIQTAFLINGDFTFNPVCRRAKASFIGGCGYNLSFLGFKHSATQNLWQQDRTFFQSGECR
jgi:hypothetical protein